MDIITWNCNMAFRKKYESIMLYSPDVLVLQECENEERLSPILQYLNYTDFIWYGDNPNKGVGIFSFNGYDLELDEDFNKDFEYIIPLTLIKKRIRINLFAIWAMPHKTDRKKNYVMQIWGAINYYQAHFNEQSILIGDFNSNTIWDKKYRTGNHSDVVEFLNERNIISFYHQERNIRHGQEPDPTIYLLKQLTKPYHLDYCFVSKDLITTDTEIEIGTAKKWLKLSDHMPLIIKNLEVES